MSELIDFIGSEAGEFRQSALLERNPSTFPALAFFGAIGPEPVTPIWETHFHTINLGFTYPGHIERIGPIPNDEGQLRYDAASYVSSVLSPPPFTHPLPINLPVGDSQTYYRLLLRARGIAELIPWNEDNSPVIIPVGRWSKHVGIIFRLTGGNLIGLRSRKFRYQMPSDWYAVGRTDAETVEFGIIANSASVGNGQAEQGARFIDRLISVSVRSDQVAPISLSVVTDISSFVAPGSTMRMGGSLGGGQFDFAVNQNGIPIAFSTQQIGQIVTGIFWGQNESINPPSMAYPHDPMLISTIDPNRQVRMEVMFLGAYLEASARPEEYFDLLNV